MPYHLYVVSGRTILVDARDDYNQAKIRAFANQHFFGNESGVVEMKGGKEHYLGCNALNYYHTRSVGFGLVVVSLDHLTPFETRPIARNYVG